MTKNSDPMRNTTGSMNFVLFRVQRRLGGGDELPTDLANKCSTLRALFMFQFLPGNDGKYHQDNKNHGDSGTKKELYNRLAKLLTLHHHSVMCGNGR